LNDTEKINNAVCEQASTESECTKIDETSAFKDYEAGMLCGYADYWYPRTMTKSCKFSKFSYQEIDRKFDAMEDMLPLILDMERRFQIVETLNAE
jgi:hypothetical protein